MNEFPNELIEMIMLNTNYPTLKKIKYTCKLFYDLLKDKKYKYYLIEKMYNVPKIVIGHKIIDKIITKNDPMNGICITYELEYKDNLTNETIKNVDKFTDQLNEEDTYNENDYLNNKEFIFDCKYNYDCTNSNLYGDNYAYVICEKCYIDLYEKDDKILMKPSVLYLYKCINDLIYRNNWTKETFERHFDKLIEGSREYEYLDENGITEKEYKYGYIPSDLDWDISINVEHINMLSTKHHIGVDAGTLYFLAECCNCEHKQIVRLDGD